MPTTVSVVILGMINVLIIAGSCASIAFTVRKWLRGEPLVPFTPREEFDPGGVFTWIRREVARVRGRPAPASEIQVRQVWSDVRLGIVAFLVSFVPIILVHTYLQLFIAYRHEAITAIRSDSSPGVFFVWAIATVVQSPILEELIFRNLLQGMLEVYERMILGQSRLSRKWIFGALPIFVSSLVFAAMHWEQGAAAAPLFLFALVLGYLYFQTHRLTPSVVAHMTLNGFTMVQLWFLVK